jgi:protein KTI12
VYYISDYTLSIPRNVYDLESKDQNERSNNASEKDARAKVYGEVKRVLNQGNIVVLDAAGGNYIKGWRYQLYCEAKAVRTPSCVVHVGTPVEKARTINEQRLRQRDAQRDGWEDGTTATATGREEASKDGRDQEMIDEEPYERDTWENLVFRYEEPNGMNRWDSPLFTVVWDDENPPCDAIWDAMIGTKDGKPVIVRPNQATVMKPSIGEGYLHELDRITQEVLRKIIEWSKDHEGEGGEVVIDEGPKGRVTVELPANAMSLPALQRLRRQFISLNRQTAVSVARIKESFVGYLNDSFQVA